MMASETGIHAKGCAQAKSGPAHFTACGGSTRLFL